MNEPIRERESVYVRMRISLVSQID
jgi:hypothetical protein